MKPSPDSKQEHRIVWERAGLSRKHLSELVAAMVFGAIALIHHPKDWTLHGMMVVAGGAVGGLAMALVLTALVRRAFRPPPGTRSFTHEKPRERK